MPGVALKQLQPRHSFALEDDGLYPQQGHEQHARQCLSIVAEAMGFPGPSSYLTRMDCEGPDILKRLPGVS